MATALKRLLGDVEPHRVTGTLLRLAQGARAVVGVPVVGWIEWRAGLVLAVSLFGSSGLWWLLATRPDEMAADSRPLMVAGALLWTALAAYTALRRRLYEVDGSVVIGSVIVLFVAEGLVYDEVVVKWLCVCALLVTPLMAQMLLPVRGVVLATVGSVVGGMLVVAHMPATTPLRVYALVTVLALLLTPVGAVGVLVHQLRAARDLAQRSATTDQLTGLLNRRGLAESLPSVLRAAREQGCRPVVVVIDVDHFKQVNDRYGHQCGDDVLVAVAETLAAQVRESDVLVRTGGEEFAWVTSFPDGERARAAAERARLAVAAQRRPGLPPVTISLGIAMAGPDLDPDLAAGERALSRLLVTADRALYRAKHAGRDRAVLAVAAPAVAAPAVVDAAAAEPTVVDAAAAGSTAPVAPVAGALTG